MPHPGCVASAAYTRTMSGVSPKWADFAVRSDKYRGPSWHPGRNGYADLRNG
jgi:hypothetical protein